jgi:hypothetical protein
MSSMESYVRPWDAELRIRCVSWDLDASMTRDSPQTTPLMEFINLRIKLPNSSGNLVMKLAYLTLNYQIVEPSGI